MAAMNLRQYRKAFLTGVGSLIDLQGMATYRSIQALMPKPAPKLPTAMMFLQTSAKMNSKSLNHLRGDKNPFTGESRR